MGMTPQTTEGRWAVIRLSKRKNANNRVVDTFSSEGDARAEAIHLNVHTNQGEHIVERTQTTATEPLDHLIRKGGYWYRPNKQGYTTEVVAAGRYTRSDAEREARVEPHNMQAVPLSTFRRASPEVLMYAEHLRSLGFTVTPPKDLLA